MGLRHTRPVAINLSCLVSDLQLLVSSYIYETEESLRKWCESQMCVTFWPIAPATIVFSMNELSLIFVSEKAFWNVGYASGRDTIYCAHAWRNDGLPRIASFKSLQNLFCFVLSHRGDIRLSTEACGCNRSAMKKAARNLPMHCINGKLIYFENI